MSLTAEHIGEEHYSITKESYEVYQNRFGEYTLRREGDYSIDNFIVTARTLYNMQMDILEEEVVKTIWKREIKFIARDKSTSVESFSVECI